MCSIIYLAVSFHLIPLMAQTPQVVVYHSPLIYLTEHKSNMNLYQMNSEQPVVILKHGGGTETERDLILAVAHVAGLG